MTKCQNPLTKCRDRTEAARACHTVDSFTAAAKSIRVGGKPRRLFRKKEMQPALLKLQIAKTKAGVPAVERSLTALSAEAFLVTMEADGAALDHFDQVLRVLVTDEQAAYISARLRTEVVRPLVTKLSVCYGKLDASTRRLSQLLASAQQLLVEVRQLPASREVFLIDEELGSIIHNIRKEIDLDNISNINLSDRSLLPRLSKWSDRLLSRSKSNES